MQPMGTLTRQRSPLISFLQQNMRHLALQNILLTSFGVWRPDQPSNSSDDLLQIVSATYANLAALRFLRQIPVHFEIAPQQVIAAIDTLRPSAVICCGMGEPRDKLGLESTAVSPQGHSLNSPLPLTLLSQELRTTEISHDAGQFVCNRLYYDTLNYLQATPTPCLFVHVPRLTPQNSHPIAADFLQILDRIHQRLGHRLAHPREVSPSALSA